MTDVLKMVNEAAHMIERYSFQYDDALRTHLSSITNLPVSEAQREILDYIEKNNAGGCLYLVTRFLEEFSEATYGFIPTENVEDSDKRRTASKVIAIVGDRVYDLAEAVENKNTSSADSLILCVRNCNVPIAEYCQKNLKNGEVLTILPNPKEYASEPFNLYFFSNSEAVEVGKE